jgi:4-hydroxybenzoate polyprenyltransferase
MSLAEENERSFFKRFWIYQKERFPVFQHGVLIVVFTFSSVNYSLNARNSSEIPDWSVWVFGMITAFLFFFLLRLFDEFKDAEEDAKFRPYRPVPRGLISFKELKGLIVFSLAIIFGLNGFFQTAIIPVVLVVLIYMGLMTKEFFVATWLKSNPVIYMLSHMLIMTLFDLYTTGLDWVLKDVSPSPYLYIFLVISFFNGMVIEMGRKIRSTEQEEEGVETYSKLWGAKKSVGIWFGVLSIVFLLSSYCMLVLSYSFVELGLLLLIFLFSGFVGYQFFVNPIPKNAKQIEIIAGLWTLSMYLLLGGISGLWRLTQLF